MKWYICQVKPLLHSTRSWTTRRMSCRSASTTDQINNPCHNQPAIPVVNNTDRGGRQPPEYQGAPRNSAAVLALTTIDALHGSDITILDRPTCKGCYDLFPFGNNSCCIVTVRASRLFIRLELNVGTRATEASTLRSSEDTIGCGNIEDPK